MLKGGTPGPPNALLSHMPTNVLLREKEGNRREGCLQNVSVTPGSVAGVGSVYLAHVLAVRCLSSDSLGERTIVSIIRTKLAKSGAACGCAGVGVSRQRLSAMQLYLSVYTAIKQTHRAHCHSL